MVFLVLSSSFAADPDRRLVSLASRVKRILVPWAVWFAAYGILNHFRGLAFMPEGNPILAVLTGSSIHLWYLPFIFGATYCLGQAGKFLSIRQSAIIYAMLGLAVLGTASLWREPSLSWPLPLPQYMHALAAMLLGGMVANRKGLSRTAFWILIALFTAGTASLLPYKGLGLPYLIGTVLTVPVLVSKKDLAGTLRVERLSECMMGVYLSHFFWWMVLLKLGKFPGPLLPIAIFSVSTLSVFLFRRAFPRAAPYVV